MKKGLLLIVLLGVFKLAMAQNTLNEIGNVGIGTLTPETMLHVKGIQSYNWLTTFNNTETTGHKMYFGYGNGSTNYGLYITGGRGIASQFDFGIENKFYVMGNGNVGIGTQTLRNVLQVNGNIAANAATDPTNTYLLFQRPSDGYIGARLGNAYAMSGYRGHLVFETNAGGSASDMIEQMRITSNGKVGIGTVNPQSKLEVLGDISSFQVGVGQADISTSPKQYVNFGSNNHGSVLLSSNLYFAGNDLLKTAITHPTVSGAAILMPGNSMPNQGSIAFYTSKTKAVNADENYTGSLSMIINGTGNVGIGTTAPDEKLAVNGKIRAHEIKVETDNWPDYVFDDDYKITSLTDLEKYIKTNKHLPDMPSAKEIKNNGLELGEIVKQQQKKIEELTLHQIELNKRLDVLLLKLDEQNKLSKKSSSVKP